MTKPLAEVKREVLLAVHAEWQSMLMQRRQRCRVFTWCLAANMMLATLPIATFAARPLEPQAAARTQSPNAQIVLERALAFEETLSRQQRSALRRPYTFDNASNWSNLPEFAKRPARVGLATSTLSPFQWEALNALIAATTGSGRHEGSDEIQQILNGDDYIHRHGRIRRGYGRDQYHVAFLGQPSSSGRWQFQFGGHHIAINKTFEGGRLTGATPSFRGVDPGTTFAEGGTDNQPMAQEHRAFVTLLTSLNDAQRDIARYSRSPGDVVVGPGRDWAFPAAPQGLPASNLAPDQRAMLMAVIETYVSDVDNENAEYILARYRSELDSTFIGFAGAPTLSAAGDYVRIDGPSVWIEFVMDTPFSFPAPHPHTVWRDKRTDYGGYRRH